MKNQKHLAVFCIVIIFTIFFSFISCSKSSKSDGNNSEKIEDISTVDKTFSNEKLSNTEKGIKITITNAPSGIRYMWVGILETQKYDRDTNPIAEAVGEINNGKIEFNLHIWPTDDSWTKPGEYYLSFIHPSMWTGWSESRSFYFYTKGATLQELGIKTNFYGVPENENEFKKLPTYLLKATENIINYNEIKEIFWDASGGKAIPL
jgi:hypothetical protein